MEIVVRLSDSMMVNVHTTKTGIFQSNIVLLFEIHELVGECLVFLKVR